MEEKRILTGSRAFFTGMDGFRPHDTDYCVLVNKEDVKFLFKSYRIDRKNHACLFYYVRNPKNKMLRWMVRHAIPMSLCMFLVPEFCNEFGITIDDLPSLQPLRDRLDKRHGYIGLIYDFYIENGSMTLTGEQLRTAFEEYLKERTKI